MDVSFTDQLVHHISIDPQGLPLPHTPFKTFVVEWLCVETNESSLENRHIKLGMQYATGGGLSFNSCLRLGFNPLCKNVYDNNLIQSQLK